jgi:two-component system chemotaxis sensor kinase CheA
MSIDLSKFHATFFTESFEGLDIMESSLLDMDHLAALDADLLGTILRAAHSIKGGSGTFGFGKVSEFCQSLEAFVDRIKSKEIDINQSIINTLLESVYCTREMLLAEKDNRDYDANHVAAIQVKLKDIPSGQENPAP